MKHQCTELKIVGREDERYINIIRKDQIKQRRHQHHAQWGERHFLSVEKRRVFERRTLFLPNCFFPIFSRSDAPNLSNIWRHLNPTRQKFQQLSILVRHLAAYRISMAAAARSAARSTIASCVGAPGMDVTTRFQVSVTHKKQKVDNLWRFFLDNGRFSHSFSIF